MKLFTAFFKGKKIRNQINNDTCIGVFNCIHGIQINDLFSPFSRNGKFPGFPGCIKSNPKFVTTKLIKVALRYQKYPVSYHKFSQLAP